MHHPIGDLPGSRWLVIRIAENVVHSWDLATAIGADPGLDDRLIEFAYAFYTAPPFTDGALYTIGYFAAPTNPLAAGASPLDRLIYLAGRG